MFKVLVVDDDDNITLFISRLLTKKFHCTVISAKNGLVALSQMKKEEPEVIFLDVTMPVMDGIEMLTALKEDEKYCEIPVIMLTAVSERAVIEKAMNIGVLDYILKPLVYETVFERMKEIFSNIKKMREIEELKKSAEADTNEGKPKILIVDGDESFRRVFGTQMEKNYNVLEAENGAEGLTLFMDERPKIVCLGENLHLINEKLLAQKIKQISKDIVIYAVRENMNISEEEKSLFNMVIPRGKK
ncbi:MAG: response regulator [Melioribacteraceae bacterium]|nr:response regulator [Melioribacteraceae bacterium]